uniref:protein RALF-like 34 n=1 Tax=Erigeron canadensis TaxID=72917 RepID=UPI001CB90E44|nr:protein RALF-like 34 [Erigeron canadensis]
MAFPLLHTLFLLSILLLSCPLASHASVDATNQFSLRPHSDETGMGMSVYDVDIEDEEIDFDNLSVSGRRSLLWRSMRYYISYGALSANRIPCPPRSGRSYYTQNCWRARGPVHPYTRGCSTITRCRR